MKILIYWMGGFDTPGPSNHLLESLIYDILEENISVHLIQGSIKKVNKEIPSFMENNSNFTYDTLKRRDISKKNFISRYFEEVIYVIRTITLLKKQKDIDLVFVRSSPTALFAILVNKFILRKPILYGVQDMWPGSAVASGVMRSKMLKFFFEKTQKIAYRYSDVITAISEDMKFKLMEQGVDAKKIKVVYNWYDDQNIEEISWDDNLIVKKYNLNKDDFYVQYAGTMGYVFDYEKIVYAAKRLKIFKDIKFQMIGQGSQKNEFQQKVNDTKLENIKFYDLEPQELVPHVYSACDICVIPLKRDIIGNSVPSKAGLLMACKRPIVNSVDSNSHYYKIFNENNIGISVSNENEDDFVDAILEMYKNRDEVLKKGLKAYEYGKTAYSRKNNTSKFINIFKSMVRND